MDEVMEYAHNLSRQSPNALRRGKALMLAALEGRYDEALMREAENQRDLLASEDGMEGFMAFLQKRDPVWTGK